MKLELEDAIKHAEEKSGSCECGKEHAQLAKWLKELTALRAIPASAPVSEDRKDAERFRFMLDDHAEKTTRQRVRELFERLPVMSLSAARAAIDSLQKGE